MSIQEIILDHPHLKPEDIFAAQEFAADYLAADSNGCKRKAHEVASIEEADRKLRKTIARSFCCC